MFNKIQIKKKEEHYCVLHKENKGYYLSKMDIAKSLNFDPVEVGSKKDCENYIRNNNKENNFELVNPVLQI